MDAEMLKMVIQAGCFGLVVFVVGWVFAKLIPQMNAQAERRDSQFLAALDKRDENHAAALTGLRDYWDGRMERMEDTIERRYVSPFGGNGKG